MIVEWKAWLDCSDERAAQVVITRVQALAFPASQAAAMERHRTGFVGSWAETRASSWNDCVIETIATAQLLGSSWLLAGDIRTSAEGILSKSAGQRIVVPGVTMISFLISDELAV